DSGADVTEALPAGRWGHLSRLTEYSTPVEVAETTQQNATPRLGRRQTPLPARSRACRYRAGLETLPVGRLLRHGGIAEGKSVHPTTRMIARPAAPSWPSIPPGDFV